MSLVDAPTNLGIEPSVLKTIYGQIARLRAVDLAIKSGLSSGTFQFTYWPYTGQEAIPATLSTLTTERDYMVSIYRGVHDQVAKGVPLREMFAEALGRGEGLNKGKGGTAHLCCPQVGSMLTTAIVGSGPPIANGLALAAQLRGEDRVTIVNFGDGATSIGAVHEAMNLAGVWKLPVIFVCQNNQIGEFTLVPDYTASQDFASRAAGYGFEGARLDTNDVVTFHREMKRIIDKVRAGGGPVFVEAVTMRLGGHSGVGDTTHLSKEDLKVAKEAWAAPRTRRLLLETGVCTEQELAAIEAAAEAEVEAAIAQALQLPAASADDVYNDLYADPDTIPRRGHHPARGAEASFSGETRTMVFGEAILDAQDLALGKDPGVVLLGEDIGDPPGGVFKTSNGLETKYGKARVRATPIAETAIVGAAIGASIAGLRPVAELMFCDFVAVAMDQIANHAAKQRYMSGGLTHLPMTVRILVGGGLGGLGAQHSQSLESWLLHTPGLKVAYPSTPAEAKGLLTSCIFDEDPCIHLESMKLVRLLKDEVPLGDYRIPLGVAKVKRPGADISLVSFGWQVHECLAASELLAAEDISAEVVDLRSLMPLDYHRVLDSVRKTRRALVVHAATEFCGLGSEIAATLNEELFSTLKAPAGRLGAAYLPLGFSRAFETECLPSAQAIAARAREIVGWQ